MTLSPSSEQRWCHGRAPYWKGYLKLSLVTCPVALFPASSQSEKTHFHQINRKTGNRLRQQMVDERTGKVVERTTRAAAMSSPKASTWRSSRKNWKRSRSRAPTRSTSTNSCPPTRSTGAITSKPVLRRANGKNGAEAFAVIRDAMKDKDRVALARIVLANREHIIAIEPFGKGLLGTTLRYDYEVRDEKAYLRRHPEPRVDKDMVDLAGHILDSKAGHFDAGKFKDEYEAALQEAGQAQGRRQDHRGAPEPRGRSATSST